MAQPRAKPKWKKWTKKEDAYLITLNRQGLNAKIIYNYKIFPDRTYLAIDARLRKLRNDQKQNKEECE